MYFLSLAELNKALREKGALTKEQRLHRSPSGFFWISGGRFVPIYTCYVYDLDLNQWVDEVTMARDENAAFTPVHVPVKSPARDNQKRKVYKSEWAAQKEWGINAITRMLTWNETVALFNRVVSEVECLKGKSVKIKQIRGKKRCYYRPYDKTVSLQLWGQTRLTLLHELAHAVVDHAYEAKDQIPDHGPEFCTVFLALVEKYTKVRFRDELLASMRKQGCRTVSLKAKEIKFIKNDSEVPDLFEEVGIAASEPKK
jgi:hypothetical protein